MYSRDKCGVGGDPKNNKLVVVVVVVVRVYSHITLGQTGFMTYILYLGTGDEDPRGCGINGFQRWSYSRHSSMVVFVVVVVVVVVYIPDVARSKGQTTHAPNTPLGPLSDRSRFIEIK